MRAMAAMTIVQYKTARMPKVGGVPLGFQAVVVRNVPQPSLSMAGSDFSRRNVPMRKRMTKAAMAVPRTEPR
jgi:hypothetical protein